MRPELSGNGADDSPAAPRHATGAELRGALLAAASWLEHHAEAINALNVFPVPDGDTGTNMALTMRAAVKDLDDEAVVALGAGDVAARMEYGALMGARGNSGVILSQLLRGFARTLEGQREFDGLMLADALKNGAAMGYFAVIKPVEGTMLTVAREAAEAAIVAARQRNDLNFVLAEALTEARASLARTPDQLELLRQAGVVDAGGMGIVVLLEGIQRFQTGATDLPAIVPLNLPTIDLSAVHAHHPDDFGYCTNFMIRGQSMPFDAIRDHYAATGQSVVVVGDDRLIKVHVHTLDPGSSLSYATNFGALTQIKIDNMDDQRAAFASRSEQPTSTGAPDTPIAVLAVAAADGQARILTSLGASQIVPGGQTMNPSAADILAAIEGAPAASVIVLPNNGNIVMAARQAAALASKPVNVVPSKSLPQGLAALLAYRGDAALGENVAAMTEALVGVKTGEVTRAVRSVTLDGMPVRAGDVIALLDDRLVASTLDLDAALLKLLGHMAAQDAELITIFCGQAVDANGRTRVEQLLAKAYPTQALEILDGGQPHYDYIVSVE